jgi:hypothetical protein
MRTELALEDLATLLVMPHGILCVAELRQQPDERGVGLVRERVDHHPSPRVCKCFLIGSVPGRQLSQNGHVRLPQALAFSGAPLLEAETRRQVESVDELASEQRRTFLERLGRRISGNADSRDVDECAVRFQLDAVAHRHEMRVEGRAELCQAPAERRAWIVRSFPEEVAEALAKMRPAGRGEVRE